MPTLWISSMQSKSPFIYHWLRVPSTSFKNGWWGVKIKEMISAFCAELKWKRDIFLNPGYFIHQTSSLCKNYEFLTRTYIQAWQEEHEVHPDSHQNDRDLVLLAQPETAHSKHGSFQEKHTSYSGNCQHPLFFAYNLIPNKTAFFFHYRTFLTLSCHHCFWSDTVSLKLHVDKFLDLYTAVKITRHMYADLSSLSLSSSTITL